MNPLIDPENPVVKLCVAGMDAEAVQNFDLARAHFEQAWAISGNHLEACIAAHYLARHQATSERILYWNQQALHFADAWQSQQQAGDATSQEIANSLATFYPSLYLNLGKSYEALGDTAAARQYYQMAEQEVARLTDEYGKVVRGGIARGLQRTSEETGSRQ